MSTVEVPMEFVAGWHMSTRNIQRSACFIEWLEGAVGHCGDLVGIGARHSSLYLIKVLWRPCREDPTHVLAYLLHLVGTQLVPGKESGKGETLGTWIVLAVVATLLLPLFHHEHAIVLPHATPLIAHLSRTRTL